MGSGGRVVGRVVALLLVLALLPLPGAEAGTAGADSLPEGWVQAGEAGRVPPVSRLSEGLRTREMTLERLRELRSEILAAPRELGGAGLHVPATIAVEASDSETAQATSGRREIPIDAGDLDGDGRDDVLALEFFPFFGFFESSEDLTLRALSGQDGSELWSTTLGFDDAFLVSDLDGDADLEVAFLRVDYIGGPVVLVDQAIEVVDGGTGDQIWSRGVLGEIVVTGAFGAAFVGNVGVFAFAVVVGIHDLVVDLRDMADADGDAAGELFLGTLDYGLAFAGAVLGVGASAGRFVATTLDGASGEEIGRAEARAAYGLPWAIPTPDLSGDGLADLALLEEVVFVRRLSAASVEGDRHWTTEPAGHGSLASLGDTTGDGLAEVLLLGTFFYDERIAWAIDVHDGETGEHLWGIEASDGSFLYRLAGDIDGDGGLDVLVAEFTFDDAEERWVLTLRGLGGTDGSEIWSREIPEAEGTFLLLCFCPSDLSGDGVADVMVAEFAGFGTDPSSENEVRGVSGADGATLWTTTFDDFQDLPVPLGGDASGDDTEDLRILRVDRDEGAETYTATVDVREGSDNATPVFEVQETFDSPVWWITGIGGDVTGDGKTDLVAGLEDFDAGRIWVRAYGPSGLLWAV